MRTRATNSIGSIISEGSRSCPCYRRQGAVENLFFMYKRTLGTSLRSWGYESQKREAMIGCNILNRMAELGKLEPQGIVGEKVGLPKGPVRAPNRFMHQRHTEEVPAPSFDGSRESGFGPG